MRAIKAELTASEPNIASYRYNILDTLSDVIEYPVIQVFQTDHSFDTRILRKTSCCVGTL